jgi:hypothetical protein
MVVAKSFNINKGRAYTSPPTKVNKMITLKITQKEWHLLIRAVSECGVNIDDGYSWDYNNADEEFVYSKEDQRDSDALEKLHNKLEEAYRNDK